MKKIDLIKRETEKAFLVVPGKKRDKIDIAQVIMDVNFSLRTHVELNRPPCSNSGTKPNIDPISNFIDLRPCDEVSTNGIEEVVRIIRQNLIMAINAQLGGMYLDLNRSLEISTFNCK